MLELFVCRLQEIYAAERELSKGGRGFLEKAYLQVSLLLP